MQAGFDAARGDLIVTIDGDLQNDPADIPDMISLLEKEDVDVVCGWREYRQDPPVRKLFSRTANRLISSLTGVKLHDFGCSLKVYRRSVLERTRLYGEMHRFLPALLTEVGAQIREVAVRHRARKFGRSKYGLDRTLRVVLDLLFVLFFRKYLQRPLHIFGGIGVICFLPGSLMLIYLVVIKLALNQEIGGRPLLMLGILLTLIGLMFIGQGFLGELIIRILHANEAREHYHLVDKKINKTPTRVSGPKN
jgi:glycosyltransferase involved in cell wall biosynthesis